jgi:hypothetical protein
VNGRSALGVLLIAGFVGTIFYIPPPIFATFAESYLTVERANVSISDSN